MDTSDYDNDNYSHHYGDDFDYTTVHNAEHTSVQSYNSGGASVNASVAGSKQYKHIAQAHGTDMLPSAYDELLKCPVCLNRTANSLLCLAKADSAAKQFGLRCATQLAIDDLWKQFNKAPASATGEFFHKGNALLQYMYTKEATSGDTKRKVH